MHTIIVVSSIVIGWLICSVLTYGRVYAYFTQEFPRQRGHSQFAMNFAIGGPLTLGVAIFCSWGSKCGFKFRNYDHSKMVSVKYD